MKIYFTLKPRDTPYGGGNSFVKNITEALIHKNYTITYILEPGIDIIFIIDPRDHYESIVNYKKQYPNVKIIHRVNENDIKREQSINIEPLLVQTMKISDRVVFVSKWLQQYYLDKYKLHGQLKCSAIINGCDDKIFHPLGDRLPPKNKLKLVTHHFSSNYLKGFHIYNELDKLMNEEQDFEFTFIGNYNRNYQPKNIKLVGACTGKELADHLRSADVYLTATQNEPGAMHYIEGLSCGLPILYAINGGGAHEVCNPYGEEYCDISSFKKKLDKIRNDYAQYTSKINYTFLSKDRCCKEYIDLVVELINESTGLPISVNEKVYLLYAKDNWIINELAKEWIQHNKHLHTENVNEATIIWIMCDYIAHLIPYDAYKKKKVITTIHHMVPWKDIKKASHYHYLNDITDVFVTIDAVCCRNMLSAYVTKPITTIHFWHNENRWMLIDDKTGLRSKYMLQSNEFLVGSFQRDTEADSIANKTYVPKYEKGPDIFLQAVKLLKTHKHPNLVVVLTGDRREYLMNELTRIGIKFYHFGLVQLEQINELYNCLDLYVVGSRIEGGPRAIHECSLLKIPLLTTRVGIVPLLCHPDSIYDMNNVDSILKCRTDTEYNYNQAQRYNIGNYMNKYTDMLLSALGCKKR